MKDEVRPKTSGRLVLSVCLVAGLLLSYGTTALSDNKDQSKEFEKAAALSAKAAKAFDQIMQTPDKAIPKSLLDRAEAVAVCPGVVKAAFIVGAEGGRCVVSRRTAHGWSAPVFFRAIGGSVGPQIGAGSTDLVLLFMNKDGLNELLKDKFELGAEASAALGPVGREAAAATDALLKAEIISYSRSRGLFAGVDLKGVVIKPDDDLNEAIYRMKARELLTGSSENTSQGSANLLAFPLTIKRYSTNR
jgi:lipid-binding SYLF domain-containing protein